MATQAKRTPWQHRQKRLQVQLDELLKAITSILIALSSNEEKRAEEICVNQPESGRLEEDGLAVETETPPQPLEPLPPPQSLAVQPSLLPSLEKFGEDEQEEVVVAEIMVERSIGRSENMR